MNCRPAALRAHAAQSVTGWKPVPQGRGVALRARAARFIQSPPHASLSGDPTNVAPLPSRPDVKSLVALSGCGIVGSRVGRFVLRNPNVRVTVISLDSPRPAVIV